MLSYHISITFFLTAILKYRIETVPNSRCPPSSRREMLKDFRDDDGEEEEEEEASAEQGRRRPEAPARSFSAVVEQGSGKLSAKLSGSATESARGSDAGVSGKLGNGSGGSRGDIDGSSSGGGGSGGGRSGGGRSGGGGGGKEVPSFKDRKSVSSSLRPMTGSLDSHKLGEKA